MNTVPKLDDDDWDLEAQDKQRIEKEKKKNLLMQLFRETGIAKVPAILKFLGAFLDDRLSGKVHSAMNILVCLCDRTCDLIDFGFWASSKCFGCVG